LLTGGIGLIAGAALGGKQRKKNQMHLVLKADGIEWEVSFKPNAITPELYTAFKYFAAKAG
jgi:hypothetical protein